MKELIGKTITGMAISEGEHVLKFSVQDGEPVYYVAEGDCCSETWFADIIFNRNRWQESEFPFTVACAEDLEMPSWVENIVTNDGRGRQECDQVYGERLVHNLGSVDIVYRNSSNGYYGGWCGFADMENPYQAEYIAKQTFTDITKDWRA